MSNNNEIIFLEIILLLNNQLYLYNDYNKNWTKKIKIYYLKFL